MIAVWIIMLVTAVLLGLGFEIDILKIISGILKIVAWIGIFTFFGILSNWFVKLLIVLNIIEVLIMIVIYIKE